MNSIYVIGDLHFGNSTIFKQRGFYSIEEHDAVTIERINSRCDKSDTLIICGDVVSRYMEHVPEFLQLLICRKRIILGNHDRQERLAEVLTNVLGYYGSYAHRQYLFTHIPVHPFQFEKDKKRTVNVHGHLHSKRINLNCVDPWNFKDPRYINVSWEQLNGFPMLIS